MSAELEVFHALSFVIAGVHYTVEDFDSLAESVKGAAAAIASGVNPIVRRVNVPINSNVVPWVWADTSGFQYMAAKVLGGAGFVQIGLRYNAPTSADDLTPTGSINHWKEHGQSCVGAFERDSERAYIHATALNEVQDSSGVPGVWAEAAKVNGVADKLAFRNEGTAAVVVAMVVIPK